MKQENENTAESGGSSRLVPIAIGCLALVWVLIFAFKGEDNPAPKPETANTENTEDPDFDRPNVVLREARNVKYQDFVAPGRQLVVEASIFKTDDFVVTLKVQGSIEDKVAVSGRLVLERGEPDQVNAAMVALLPRTRMELRVQLALLQHGHIASN